MKIKYLLVAAWMLTLSLFVFGQKANPYVNVFPQGTIIHDNVPYNNEADPGHLLDFICRRMRMAKFPWSFLFTAEAGFPTINTPIWAT
ncbi:MAG TPA: hypothetical protein VFD58_35315 [Blastocatellia bacterium]|nr:hypothetical protein [Blastocatellia bacterium]